MSTYTLDLFVPPRTPLVAADDLADTLEKVGNEVLGTPYPYDLKLRGEASITIMLAWGAEAKVKKCQNINGGHINIGVRLDQTIEAYRKLGAQALKIAHVLEQYRKQETGENTNE
jgi:hypothetical protein